MKYKSALVTDLSGSIEGLTASRNKGGQYFRARVIPTNPQTALQSTARQAFTQQSQTWPTLLGSERSAWDAFAPLIPATGPLGQTIALSGQQAYMQATVPIQFGNEFIPTDPLTQITLPPTNPTGAPTTVSPQIGAASQALDLVGVTFDSTDGWNNVDEGALFIYVGQAAPAGRRPQDQQLRFAGAVDGDLALPPASPQTFANPWPWLVADIGKEFVIVTVTMQPATFMPGQRDMSLPVAVAA